MELHTHDSCFQINKSSQSISGDTHRDSFIKITTPTPDLENPTKIIPKEGDCDDTLLSTEYSSYLDIPMMEASDSGTESEAELFDLPSEIEDEGMLSTLMCKILWTPD